MVYPSDEVTREIELSLTESFGVQSVAVEYVEFNLSVCLRTMRELTYRLSIRHTRPKFDFH